MLFTPQKPLCLPNDYAQKLARLATTFDVTGNDLVLEALDLLFQREREAETLASWDYLDELEVEENPLPAISSRPISPDEIVSIVGTPAV